MRVKNIHHTKNVSKTKGRTKTKTTPPRGTYVEHWSAPVTYYGEGAGPGAQAIEAKDPYIAANTFDVAGVQKGDCTIQGSSTGNPLIKNHPTTIRSVCNASAGPPGGYPASNLDGTRTWTTWYVNVSCTITYSRP